MKYTEKMDTIMISKLIQQFEENPDMLIEKEEKAFHKKVTDICDQVVRKKIHIILLTGPSASGKTTTATRLVSELQLRGMRSHRISLDNFYRDNDQDPLWEDGQPNFESIKSLDVECFHEKIDQLLRDGTSDFPIFDFKAGKRSKDVFTLSFDQDTCLVFEGIHALNPLLCGHKLEGHTMRIYVSVHSDFVNDKGNPLLPARNLRFLRRLLRDHVHRGNSAGDTLKMWNHVLQGEKLYIQPYRHTADIHVNTVHSYEPFLYQERASGLLRPLINDQEYLHIVGPLMATETLFPSLSPAKVPESSLLQEFI